MKLVLYHVPDREDGILPLPKFFDCIIDSHHAGLTPLLFGLIITSIRGSYELIAYSWMISTVSVSIFSCTWAISCNNYVNIRNTVVLVLERICRGQRMKASPQLRSLICMSLAYRSYLAWAFLGCSLNRKPGRVAFSSEAVQP